MRSVSILSVASLLAVAAAQPAQKRDMVTVTEVDTIVKTVDVTSTVYAGQASAPSPAPQAGGSHQQHGHQHQHQHKQHHEKQPKQHPSSQAPAPAPKPTASPEPVEPKNPPAPAPAPPKTVAAPAPPPPQPTKAKPPPTTGGQPANALSGEMTFYAPGLGSCGITNTETDHIVALAVPMMANGANPNDNPKCGQKITIEFHGKRHEATVTDTCYACAREDVDVSPTLFTEFAAESIGRVPGVKWWFNDASFM